MNWKVLFRRVVKMMVRCAQENEPLLIGIELKRIGFVIRAVQ